jgi:virginiamycin B lyase
VGQEGNYVARLEPKSGAITRYPMPDPDAKDPHTIAFDAQGNLWFTLQNSNMVGHLVKKTGKATIMKMSTPRSRPYGSTCCPKSGPAAVSIPSAAR